MRLAYQAFDKAGRAINDTIEAGSMDDATERLRRQGVFVTAVHPLNAGHDAEHKRGRRSGSDPALGSRTRSGPALASWSRVSRLKHLAMFTRQLYVLLSTGTPMVDALHALARQTRNEHWRLAIEDLRDQVEQGNPLSHAMEAHKDCFDPIYRSLICAGERGGKFEPILDRLSMLTQKQLKTRNTVVGALVYPLLLLVVSVGVLISMFVFVLPRFTMLFKTLDMPLPPTTKILMAISGFTVTYWWVIFPTALAAVGGAAWWLTTPGGRSFLDTALLRIPVIGDATRSFITARVIRLLGVLSDSYVPLLDALDLAGQAAVNHHYRRLMEDAKDAVTRGEPISVAFADERLISPTIYEAMRSGEATGRISSLLLNMADFLDEENEVVLKAVTSLLEPTILVILGLLVGLVAISLFLPLFDLTAQAGSM